ncbi:hypothetical protein PPSIR1_41514 [Plesiocystis pacifica SIR-1]|uniref:DUF2834 domain-containing protein n=1 Tax=Plesiocystis pacifica SIR-1 TaxID=391625 RepID=A6G0P4_9BACT|nr:hypothetical protein [Plesiocystis pacifica]EDM80432.1 hypothetical protein PPSIR1_41514 [Plesiocystis pacifica SIR-1]
MNKAVTVLAFLGFTAYTIAVIVAHGMPDFSTFDPWNWQVFVDLCAAALAFFWLALPEAKRLGVPAWPYALLTPVLGSIAILAYLVHREFALARRPG